MCEPGYLCADALDALLDDLNTPKAFTALARVARRSGQGRQARGRMPEGKRAIDRPCCTCRPRPGAAFRPASLVIDEAKVVNLIDARNAARKAKNFKESDRIRDELAAMGVVLKDSKDGTTWEIAR